MSDDIEKESVDFKIMLGSEYFNDAPKFELLIDDELIESGSVSEQTRLRFTRDLAEGEHVIKIRLVGKQPKHTQITDDGVVYRDQILNIEQIEIDEIELDHLFYNLSEYYKQVNVKNKQPVFNETPEPEKYINIGWNGEYRLKFNVPTYMWFLENL